MARSFFVKILSVFCITLLLSQQIALAGDVQEGAVCRADLRFDAQTVFSQADEARKRLQADVQGQEMRARLQKIGQEALIDEDLVKRIKDLYFVQVKKSKNTNQEQSGDCWIFAFLATLADYLYAQGLVPKGFEFSETYVYYFTNVLKVDSYFNHIIDLATGKAASQPEAKVAASLKSYLSLIADGGDDPWLKQTISLVGLVPKRMMEATFSANDTEFILSELQAYSGKVANQMLERTAALRKQGASDSEIFAELKTLKDEGSIGVHQILQAHLNYPKGVPVPEDSDFTKKSVVTVAERVNGVKTGKMLKFKDGVDFAKNFVKYDPDDLVTVAKLPNIPAGKFYRVPKSGMDNGFRNGRKFNINFLNVTSKRFFEIIDNVVLDRHKPVPFSSDVVHNVDSHGIADPHIFLRSQAYGLNENAMPLSINNSLKLGVTTVDHDMSIGGVAHPGKNGVKFDRNAPLAAAVLFDSWGGNYGPRGFKDDIVASREWLENQSFTILIHVGMLTPQERRQLKQPKVVSADTAQVFEPTPQGGGDIGGEHH